MPSCLHHLTLRLWQVEVGETAEATAQAAQSLSQLATLIPSSGLLFGKASVHAQHQQAAVRVAGQQSGQWITADVAHQVTISKLSNMAALLPSIVACY